ncbi:MAG: AbrB/MazE/SpoVT family DNA-binding domain-containing protein [Firmicutes bacterium]|nr:AbrB/MazE/SpoVT family DNA-binding domain-containing protein [Bacillota bacterium]
MLTELRKKAQITIPKEVVNKLGLKEGDQLEIVERDGIIFLMPVAVYPKKYIDELKAEISTVKNKLQSGEQLVFESVDDLFSQLDESER